ncbi:MAG: alpha/beta fold hydrolase [Actinomycetes bacterium]
MRIELEDGTPAERVEPSTGQATQGVVLCPDIMGLRPLFDEMAAKLADENGWVVVAPEPFAGNESMTLAERLTSVGNFDDLKVLNTIQQAADATGFENVVILGFCMGGMWAMKAAMTGRFRRAVSFYGMIRMPEAWRSPTQSDAIDFVTAPGACPVLQLVGSDDTSVPMSDISDLQAADVAVVIYEGAEHGFVHDPTRPTHRPEDAKDAWARALAFLDGP